MNARDKNSTESPVVISSRADAGAPSVQAETIEAPTHPSTGSGRTALRAAGQSRFHESARAQVAGTATYIDDIPEVRGTLHAAPVCSPVAHGILRKLDASAALALPGVRAVIDAGDIPGDTTLAAFAHDEPVFALDTVMFTGQVIALVVADDVMTARRAARLVKLDIEPLPAVLNVHEAHALESYVLPPVQVSRGDAGAALKRAPHQLEGRFEVGGQEHFYLEGQIAYVLPLEQNQWWVYTSTQHPGEVQHWVSHALGIANNAVTVECRRMGGGFGGKETQAGHLAVWAAIAANQLKCPVKLRLDRDDDFMITGKRHPFAYHYRVGFDDSGLLCGLELEMLVNCGFSADLSGPVADRAIFHADNAYFLEDVAVTSYRCKTNTQSHTAFRGFGGPQGVIVIERILSDIARALDLDPLDVRLRNLYGIEDRNVTHYQMQVEDNILEPLMSQLALSSGYRERREQIAAWNASSPVIKKGLALTPVKFGISFTATLFNQAGALVHVYTDGSVQVNHGGTEMGQGLNTKVAQIVADELGVPFERVLATASDTSKVPNASATAASSGTDLNGRAAQFAARHVRDNLAAFVAGLDGVGAGAVRFEGGQVITEKTTRRWEDVVGAAYANRIQLWSDGFYRTPKIHYDKATLTGRPFYYFAYGAAVSEVAIDTLTGEYRVLKVDILHDVGHSINPAIDIGQIEGGFIQGMGWLTTEQLVWNGKGYLQTHAPSTYKIPATGDVPAHFKVELWPEANREDNVHGSKAVGEPPFMLAISVYEALRDAVAQAGGDPLLVNAPATAEEVLRAVSG
ncbi:MAG TPA: xanthine dehydrogenase molybdopterin binding subunit [Hydrogenophaga sp.]|uniref:xanthine dehydrogenase molybdopterin binding subunit n=1 Tax=Hydrogenophaga sp. TaxID=1904254 RepID=UPI0008D208A7|nr:xanthine dehydrogenase molybdopterin binding subunit [Hydrogenophaga sp.]OGA77000.1 MAG: xanthine dehydrogenase molybdopterin binding subunit [Burkholderiales bacterium GWE1_65_30]OGA90461.1 MAG: xanthine dehydrogenase molybdopterin binding subunit [Burkholderiales bacterium GWF1_66_17]HAX18946.1 xanthine dehydrogenase molybdopterin binding subunit [Hydrogenophaga sp.]HBU21024.1 xanthine dehydrogenase molybdopterin binding subunit [Hydrogenophaga sp.]